MRTVILFAFLGLHGFVAAQPDAKWLERLEHYWAEIDSAYRDTLHSPLPKEERVHFTNLPRFAADKAYCVTARYEPGAGEVFGMKTSTEREPKYQRVGSVSFGGHESNPASNPPPGSPGWAGSPPLSKMTR